MTHAVENDDPTLRPPDAAAFEQQIEKLKAKRSHIALPGIRFAMWPQDARFNGDLSDDSKFNERYIEADVRLGQGALVMYFCALAHHMGFISAFLIVPWEKGTYSWTWLMPIGYIPWLLVTGGMFWMTMAAASSPSCRFNRQAQLVHVDLGGGATHVHWRGVRPFTELARGLSGWYCFILCFPMPLHNFRNKLPAKTIRYIYGSPLELNGDFDSSDWTFFSANLERLEFIRRYMEHGLESIQPDELMKRQGLVRKMDGFTKPMPNPDWWDKLMSKVFYRLLYWLCTGPLIDYWAARRRAAYRWPEEVERLCAPGADLSGFDTSVVKSRTNIYYRAGMGNGYYFVDAKGRRIVSPKAL